MNSFGNNNQQPMYNPNTTAQQTGEVSMDVQNAQQYVDQGLNGYDPNAQAAMHHNNVANYDYNQPIQTNNPNADSDYFQQMNAFNNARNFQPNNANIPNAHRAQFSQSETAQMMEMVNQIDPQAAQAAALGDGLGQFDENDPLYGYNKSVFHIKEAINAIENTEYWIPDKHSAKAPAFNKSGAQIVKALKTYLQRIQVLGQ